MSNLTDRFGREHDYLRISVTDRCNLRCLYCMPEEGMEFAPSSDLLSYDHIVEVVKAGAELGITEASYNWWGTARPSWNSWIDSPACRYSRYSGYIHDYEWCTAGRSSRGAA